MSDRLTAEPGTTRYFLQLLVIAQESDHPMDKALALAIPKVIEDRRVKAACIENQQEPTGEIPDWLLVFMQEGENLFWNRRKRAEGDGNRLIWNSQEGKYEEVNGDGYLVR